ncbi:dihydroxyacetone kinase phosphoryl donor subunit DhaM [Leifsonia kafniensis]|uniref:Phosphocarrier protein HPr n=1 Tax=Leifsonia kafniensis TaxID=475957 RepID=A0ABP7K777_9MICO
MAESESRVGVVFVSHSDKIADGLVELARQMAPNARLIAAGGTDEGSIGTSFEKVSAGISSADTGAGVVVLCDLGSAILTAETARDFLDEADRDRVVIVDAPLVEGGVAAAVAAESGENLAAVIAAAQSANSVQAAPVQPASGQTRGQQDGASAGYTRTVTLINADGLHARPAADFVKLATTFPVRVTVNGKDAKSLLGIMALGLTRGKAVEISTVDEEGKPAVDALAALIESGFGEA